jgi:hypothetical protein
MNNELIAKALQILSPGAEWTLIGDDYSSIEWLSDMAKPTAKQVADKVAELPAIELAAKETAAASKAAILDRLGITAEEAALLLA